MRRRRVARRERSVTSARPDARPPLVRGPGVLRMVPMPRRCGHDHGRADPPIPSTICGVPVTSTAIDRLRRTRRRDGDDRLRGVDRRRAARGRRALRRRVRPRSTTEILDLIVQGDRAAMWWRTVGTPRRAVRRHRPDAHRRPHHDGGRRLHHRRATTASSRSAASGTPPRSTASSASSPTASDRHDLGHTGRRPGALPGGCRRGRRRRRGTGQSGGPLTASGPSPSS